MLGRWDAQAYILNIFSLNISATIQLYNNIFQLVPVAGPNTSLWYFSITKCSALPNPFRSNTTQIYSREIHLKICSYTNPTERSEGQYYPKN